MFKMLNKKGFTLVELMIVVVILGILVKRAVFVILIQTCLIIVDQAGSVVREREVDFDGSAVGNEVILQDDFGAVVRK